MSADRDDWDIPARFREIAGRRGAAEAILGDARNWSFAALDRASDGLAASLADVGTGPGDRVALLCGNSAEFVIAYLGILKAGATVVPVNLLLNPIEINYILTDSGARGLIYQAAFADAAGAAMAEIDGGLFQVCIGASSLANVLDFAVMIGNSNRPPALAREARHDLAAILYTSGTTGRPKGAMLTHANLIANADSVAQALEFTRNDRVLVVLPMFHAFAATVGVLTPLLHGAGLAPVGRFDPKLISQTVGRHACSLFLGVPSLYGVLMRLDEEYLAQWRGVRLCVSGGAAMPVALMSAFEARFGIPVLEGDGPTECGPVTCVNPVHGTRKPGSVGLPIPQVEMRVLDAGGREVPDGVHGEVCVRSPGVMKGYFHQPEETQASFFGDWFRTGDVGYRDRDGYYYLVDRIKDLIIVNGMNVYPRVVEEVLHAHPEVAEAAVVGDADARHGELVVAHVALAPGAGATPAVLRAWCQARLGRHEIPRRVLMHASLPKNAAGKILKRELRRTGEQERGVPPGCADTRMPPTD